MVTLTHLEFHDIRFPTSTEGHGSDAMHTDPDYSAAYVVLKTNDESLNGYGLSFTLGRGTEVVIAAMESLRPFILHRSLDEITKNFGQFYHKITNESQLRWLGPEKGVIHLALSGIFNAIWDLWARVQKKPLWKLIVDMSVDEIIACIDFTYITDFLTEDNARALLAPTEVRHAREKVILNQGYPAYTTSAGWSNYSDTEVVQRCKAAMSQGFTLFKLKVGANVDDDRRRFQLIRECVGPDTPLMTDANQRWSVSQAIDWMRQLADLRPYWIEEPTSCDDVLGHAEIANDLMGKHNIRVATGEHCQNRVMFKQFLKAGAMQVCQVDSCRLGSINEVLTVLLMAKKAGVPVCPHAGGVGLCQYVQHIILVDYICITGTTEDRMCEYADHLHEHFVEPLHVNQGKYYAPQAAGYSVEMRSASMETYSFPNGKYWATAAKKL